MCAYTTQSTTKKAIESMKRVSTFIKRHISFSFFFLFIQNKITKQTSKSIHKDVTQEKGMIEKIINDRKMCIIGKFPCILCIFKEQEYKDPVRSFPGMITNILNCVQRCVSVWSQLWPSSWKKLNLTSFLARIIYITIYCKGCFA